MVNYNLDLLMAACFTAGFGLNCLVHRFANENDDILIFITFVIIVVGCIAFLPNF